VCVECCVVSSNVNALITTNQVKILRGALDMTHKQVQSVMRPLEKVYMIEEQTILDEQTMTELYDCAHSRVPVYRKTRSFVVGVVVVKTLIVVDTSAGLSVADVGFVDVPRVSPQTPLADVLHRFQKAQSHIGIVVGDDSTKVTGIVTLEDLVESLLDRVLPNDTRRAQTVQLLSTTQSLVRGKQIEF